MTSTVGVVLLHDKSHVAHLKRAAMLFDSVYLLRATRLQVTPPEPDATPFELDIKGIDPDPATSDWLEQNGMAVSIGPEHSELWQAAITAYLRAGVVAVVSKTGERIGVQPPPFPEYGDVQQRANAFYDRMSRHFASLARSHSTDVLVPLLRSPLASLASTEQREADLLHAIVANLPLPDDTTPWEVIRDFRSDPEAQIKYRRLRNWINEMAATSIVVPHAIDRLATLTDDYCTFMRLRHQRFGSSTLEIVLTTTAEVVENVARFRLSAAVRELFALKHARHTLLLNELQAPGREVAYVAAINALLKK